MFKNSQKAEIANIIDGRELLSSGDFEQKIGGEGRILRLTYKDNKDFFLIINLRTDNAFDIVFSPSETSLRDTTLTQISWSNVIASVRAWAIYLNNEIASVDPWAELDDSNTFEGKDTNFTPAELEVVDRAIDAAMVELIKEANARGINKKLDDIQDDIKFLKAEARKQTRFKWRDFFIQTITAKILEWGLDALVMTGVLKVLVENAEPFLRIIASSS